jgi:hypothetical protein
MLRGKRPAVLDAALGAAAGLFASWVMSLAYGPIMQAGNEKTRYRSPR